MKILRIKFKNINSLAGEHEIDFMQPAFTQDGIFAITGKTGAGKTSILDAICLALYGKTPRVDISGTQNDVLTRGEKDCYADIVFEVNSKMYKSSWKQEKNRNGKLNKVIREISDENDQKLVSGDKTKECDAKIIEITGLTFEQFTKVVMLAQGNFAAFLEAEAKEKGQLLEQMTGTEIYAEISKKVHIRAKSEETKKEKIEIEHKAIPVLSVEEVQVKSQQVVDFEKNKKELDTEITNLANAEKWLMDIQKLTDTIQQEKEKLPEILDQKNKASENFEILTENLTKSKSELENKEPIFKQVRDLDTKISAKNELLILLSEKIIELEKSQTTLTKTLEKQQKDLKTHQTSSEEKKKWAKENEKYANLISEYSAIEKENGLLIEVKANVQKFTGEIVELKDKAKKQQNTFDESVTNFETAEKSLSEKSKLLAEKKSELAKILDSKELSAWRTEKENIEKISKALKNWIETFETINKSQNEISNYKISIKESTDSQVKVSEQLEIDKNLAKELEEKITLLAENIQLTKTVLSLEEHRKDLKDGEACPCCGSLEHPFAQGNIPVLGNKEQDLNTLQIDFKKITTEINKNEKLLVQLGTDLKNTSNNQAKEIENLKTLQDKSNETVKEIQKYDASFVLPESEDKMPLLEDILKQKHENLKNANQIIKNSEQIEAEIKKIVEIEIHDLQKRKDDALQSKNDAETALKLTKQTLTDKQSSLKEVQEKHDVDVQTLKKKFDFYGVENIETLQKCLNLWTENQREIENLQTKISELDKQNELDKQKFGLQKNEIETKAAEKQKIEEEKLQLNKERNEIFGEIVVDVEETRLKDEIKTFEDKQVKARAFRDEKVKEFDSIQVVIQTKNKELSGKMSENLTEKSLENIKSELENSRTKSEEISKTVGALQESLRINDENVKKSKKKHEELKKQEEIYGHWKNLHDLIGSGDGKKFRDYAQSLTFKHLISLANQQLQTMHERYILQTITSNAENKYELSVIDRFQFDQERTIKNLSGGEKFIVSLALALGLSKMASKNVRVDTLFIDEGFGTLDADYLDIALNALGNLQSEGKMIGVISHLSELKDRISTHIVIEPIGKGHSKIITPYQSLYSLNKL